MTAVPSSLVRRTHLLALLALLPVLGLGAGHAVAKPTAVHHARPRAVKPCAKNRSHSRCHARKRTAKPKKASARTRTTQANPKTTAAPTLTTPAPTKTTATKPAASSPTLTATTLPTTTGASSPEATPFSPTSVWNQALPSDVPLNAQSTTYVSNLLSQISSAGLWMNTYQYSTPMFTVPPGQPTVTVKLDTASSPQATLLRQSWLQVPIPPNAKAAAGTDEHMVVYQPSTDTMWEFWKMTLQSDGWHAQWGGTMNNVSTNPGYFTSPGPSNWGATASSLPLLGGLIRPSELAAGHIDHAIALAIPNTRAQYFAWPAQRTDGNVNSTAAIPEGQRFRLDPNLDLSTIPMSPLVRMIAVAAQKYGMIVRDKSGNVTVYGEDTTAEGLPNPYFGATGWFQGQYVNNLLAAFPWAHLEAVQDTMSCCWQLPFTG
jgi:hypothetical protein